MSETKESITTKQDQEEIINWEEEATAIINDVKMHVEEIGISKKLPNSDSHIYLNIRTYEKAEYCIQVSAIGFRIVSNQYDSTDKSSCVCAGEADGEVFETPYALLDKISPSYVQSFGNQLVKQLQNLEQMQIEFNEDDELQEEEEVSEAAAK